MRDQRLEGEKIKEQDGWMNRMIPAGLDGKDKKNSLAGSAERMAHGAEREAQRTEDGGRKTEDGGRRASQ